MQKNPFRFLKRLKRSILKRLGLQKPEGDLFLKDCAGVVHVGANTGHEAAYYASCNLNVLWFEPIPDVYERLLKHISKFPKQAALNKLLTDKSGQSYSFNISGNDGLSSSILDLKGHKEMWPDVEFVSKLEIRSDTLEDVLLEGAAEPTNYDALVLDTQGSELLVLMGAEKVLSGFRFIKTEAADFEAYAGCALVDEIVAWLGVRGFEPVEKHTIRTVEGIGTYYDIVFRNTRASE